MANVDKTKLAQSVVDHQRRYSTHRQATSIKTVVDSNATKVGGIQDVLGHRIVRKDVALSGIGAQTEDIFKYTGSLLIKEIYAVITDATDTTTLSNFRFQQHDGTNTDPLCAAVDASGMTAGSIIIKSANIAGALVALNSDEIRSAQGGSAAVFYEILVNGKTGDVDNTIRLTYTGDSDTDAVCDIYMTYVPLSADASVAVVTA